MKKLILITLVATGALASQAQAGVIERACLAGGRKAASPALCGCIQNVADRTLSWGEQRRAAKLFREPGLAQEVRQSDRGRDARFWQSYRNFGATAQTLCRG